MASTRKNIMQGRREEFVGVYEEDVVVTKDNKKKIGIVLKTHRNDDSDDSGSYDEEDDEKIEAGKVMIGWYTPNPKWNDVDDTNVIDENTVELFDRSLLPGDVVRWVCQSKGNQKGHIKNVNVMVDICVVGTNYVLRNINAKNLLPLTKFPQGSPIVKGSWLGCIFDGSLELTLRLKNNSKCIISGDAIGSLVDITDQRDEDTTFYFDNFYPGQQVQGPARSFKEAKWIVGPRPILNNNLRVKAVVEEAKVSHIEVEWHVSGYTGDTEDSFTPPNPIISNKELSENDVFVLGNFKEASMQIGDKTFYILTQDDLDKCNIPRESKEKKRKSDVINKAQSATSDNHSDRDEEIEDEDDEEEEEEEEEETEENSINTPKPPHASSSNTNVSSTGRRGGSRPRRKRHAHLQKKRKRYRPPVCMVVGEKVCAEICLTRTITDVVWQDGTLHCGIESTQLYPVIHLDELEFFPGDFVIDKRDNSEITDKFGVIQSADFEGRLCNIRWLSFLKNATETSERLEDDVSVYEIADHPNFTFRPSDTVVRLGCFKFTQNEDANNCSNSSTPAPAGEVIEVNTNGKVDVLWVDGTRSCVLPSQLYVVNIGEDDNDWDINANTDEEGNQSEGGGQDEWETSSETSDVIGDIREQLNPLEDVIVRSLAALNPSGPSSDAQGTPSPPTQTNDHVIGMNKRTVEFISALDESFSPNKEGSSEISQSSEEKEDETAQTTAESELMPCKNEASFIHVDNVPSSHHFINSICTPLNYRTFNSAVMKDVRLLQAHLPEGIVVKAFSDRLDLLSVLITGPPATPYEDGLFCFDVQLPYNYPASPPNVHYHAYCSQRLNPNLYEEGKVCVSLLGTWSGKGNETWTSRSTIHQVLLSIQSLILNEEPYYNEAGYEKQKGTAEGAENSRMYNEMAVIKTLQSIHKMIKRPPEVFKNEVIAHFKERLPRLIERFGKWLGKVDEYADSTNTSGEKPLFPLQPLSKGFCLTVKGNIDQLKNLI